MWKEQKKCSPGFSFHIPLIREVLHPSSHAGSRLSRPAPREARAGPVPRCTTGPPPRLGPTGRRSRGGAGFLGTPPSRQLASRNHPHAPGRRCHRRGCCSPRPPIQNTGSFTSILKQGISEKVEICIVTKFNPGPRARPTAPRAERDPRLASGRWGGHRAGPPREAPGPGRRPAGHTRGSEGGSAPRGARGWRGTGKANSGGGQRSVPGGVHGRRARQAPRERGPARGRGAVRLPGSHHVLAGVWALLAVWDLRRRRRARLVGITARQRRPAGTAERAPSAWPPPPRAEGGPRAGRGRARAAGVVSAPGGASGRCL